GSPAHIPTSLLWAAGALNVRSAFRRALRYKSKIPSHESRWSRDDKRLRLVQKETANSHRPMTPAWHAGRSETETALRSRQSPDIHVSSPAPARSLLRQIKSASYRTCESWFRKESRR